MSGSPLNQILKPLPKGPYNESQHQSGITDPIWPIKPESNINADQIKDYIQSQQTSGRLQVNDIKVPSQQELIEQYKSDYAGRVARQDCASILRADILSSDRIELQQVLKLLTEFVVEEMNKKSSLKHIQLLQDIPDSYRVTITVGFGTSLFVDKNGCDRFGLAAYKPNYLKQMPVFEGDADSFDPIKTASDLVVIICSDHTYVNIAIVRFFAEYFNRRFNAKFCTDNSDPILKFRNVEQGFSRKDKREFLKFDDGIDNIHMGQDELDNLVYVDECDNEPEWCLRGSYLVYRKIRENMPVWESFTQSDQENAIGREKDTGKPLSRETSGHDGMIPVYPNALDSKDGPLAAHIRKVQPRRSEPDLFGIDDLERRFLRRPYPFFDGLDGDGNSVNGLQFMAFMKSLQQQFEHVTNMWQLNPDFPKKGTGIDTLYAKNILSNIDGGYYFCPPGLKGEGDYFGSGLFEKLK